jgi:hypothetical protein
LGSQRLIGRIPIAKRLQLQQRPACSSSPASPRQSCSRAPVGPARGAERRPEAAPGSSRKCCRSRRAGFARCRPSWVAGGDRRSEIRALPPSCLLEVGPRHMSSKLAAFASATRDSSHPAFHGRSLAVKVEDRPAAQVRALGQLAARHAGGSKSPEVHSSRRHDAKNRQWSSSIARRQNKAQHATTVRCDAPR